MAKQSVIKLGINGFGRIGKCVFLQLLNNPKFSICALNATNIKIDDIEDYLIYDSTHKYLKNMKVMKDMQGQKLYEFEILSDTKFKINHHIVTLLSDKDARKLNWTEHGCEYIIDATGSYLTSKKCEDHNAKYVIMSAPAKDITKTFIYGANHIKYNGEKIVSASSCTTNCIAPMLKILNDNYKINSCNFTTIHATTASQYAVDILANTRISRSLFNNIIPHTTGASSSIVSVLPELDGLIHGTSLRVPVSNCSLIDLNVELNDKTVTLSDISRLIKEHELFNIVYQINNKNLVSSDFITTEQPTILDIKASIDMGEGRFKLMIWYDNEWSYSAQLIRVVEHMNTFNLSKQINKKENEIKPKEENLLKSKNESESITDNSSVDNKYFKNIDMNGLRVVLRVDFNVPTKDGIILDDFRIRTTMNTIKYILEEKKPKYLLLAAHFGRAASESLKFIVPVLEKCISEATIGISEATVTNTNTVRFLPDGISEQTANILKTESSKVYLLENLRIHNEETLYAFMTDEEIESNAIVNLYRSFGDVFISDAFGCSHRKHMSICDAPKSRKQYGYGELIRSELSALSMLIANESKKLNILGIIGGNKIKDKMPLIDSIRKIPNSKIFVAGGIATKYIPTNDLHGSNNNIIVMKDGYGDNGDNSAQYIDNIHESLLNAYDIGDNSIKELLNLIDETDIIFWNGSLGKIEDDRYIKGSQQLAEYLVNATSKKVIIGGGETATLFNKNVNYPHIYISTGGGALLEYLQNKILYNKNIVGIEMYFK